MLSKIRLHGILASKYGEEHNYLVDSVAEAFTALNSNCKGFSRILRKYDFQIIADGHEIDIGDITAEGFKFKVLDIIPLTEGDKNDNSAIKYVVGGLEIAVGVVLDIYSYGSAGNPLILAGVSTIAGTIINNLNGISPQQYDQSGDAATSNIFDGSRNVSKEGVAIPVIYGEMIVGSLVASAIIAVDGQNI
jgi:predicted phage tail protein